MRWRAAGVRFSNSGVGVELRVGATVALGVMAVVGVDHHNVKSSEFRERNRFAVIERDGRFGKYQGRERKSDNEIKQAQQCHFMKFALKKRIRHCHVIEVKRE